MSLTKWIPEKRILRSPGVYTDCYWAVLTRYLTEYPDAHFELVSRYLPRGFKPEELQNVDYRISFELAPSKGLLYELKKRDIGFSDYRKAFKREIFSNRQAVKRMFELLELAQHQLVFLVCYERDPQQCHRSLLKEWIEHIDNEWAQWRLQNVPRY